MKKELLSSQRAHVDLAKLGADIAIARKRRHFTQQRLAEGAGVNVATIRRLERGDSGVSLGVLAMVMLTLGESGRLGSLIDVAKDDMGLLIAVNELPQRVREKRSAKTTPAHPNNSTEGGSAPRSDTPEVW